MNAHQRRIATRGFWRSFWAAEWKPPVSTVPPECTLVEINLVEYQVEVTPTSCAIRPRPVAHEHETGGTFVPSRPMAAWGVRS